LTECFIPKVLDEGLRQDVEVLFVLVEDMLDEAEQLLDLLQLKLVSSDEVYYLQNLRL
jgi:hypothetical protein